jgi:hypothetical protein
MSIFASELTLEPCYEPDWDLQGERGGYLDVALAAGSREGVRILVGEVNDKAEASIVIDRDQATRLRDWLTTWIDGSTP